MRFDFMLNDSNCGLDQQKVHCLELLIHKVSTYRNATADDFSSFEFFLAVVDFSSPVPPPVALIQKHNKKEESLNTISSLSPKLT